MSEATNLSLQTALVFYWQHALFRERLNRIDYPLDTVQMPPFSSEAVLAGVLPEASIADYFKKATTDTLLLWLALDMASLTNTPQRALVPLWIPAIVDRSGQLSPPSELAYPFIPTTLLDPLSATAPLLGTLLQFDEAWFDLFSKAQFEDWASYIAAHLKCLEHVGGGAWREKISSKGYHWRNQSIGIVKTLPAFEASDLLKQFTSIDESPYALELEEEVLIQSFKYYLGLPVQANRLTHHDLKAYLHAASIPQHGMLSINTPKGTTKSALVWNLVASQWVEAAVQGMKPPICVYAGEQAPAFNVPLSTEFEAEEVEALQGELQARYGLFLAGLDKIENYHKNKASQVALEESVHTLQKEDQALEEKADHFNQLLNHWTATSAQKSFLQKLWRFLGPGKSKELEKAKTFYENYLKEAFELNLNLPLEEQIVAVLRPIKVSRTKIHNQLMVQTDALTQSQSAKNQLLEWFQSHLDIILSLQEGDAIHLCQSLCEAMGASLFTLAARFWQIQGHTIGCKVLSIEDLESNAPPDIDWLIFDHSEHISPMRAASLLNRAKRCLALGDLANQISTPLATRRMDDYELGYFGLAKDNDALEDLQFKGLTALSSCYELVQDKSAFKRMAAHGLLAQNDLKLFYLPDHANILLAYANRCVYAQKLQSGLEETSSELPAMGYYHVRSQVELSLKAWIEQSLFNPEDIGILTLFADDKKRISAFLKDMAVTIKTLSEASDFSKKVILFAPGYTVFDKKPYLFDQGEHLFNRAFLSARAHFFFFGDMAVFDLKTHSPSGNVAKILFKLSPMPLTIPGDLMPIAGKEQYATILGNALHAERALTIVSEGLDVKSLQKIGFDHELHRLKENNVRVTLYVGTIGLKGLGIQSKAFKEQLKSWEALNVSVFLVRNLHSNAIWWDDAHYFEGQFPWLAGFGKLAAHAFRSVEGNDKLKTSFQSYLGMHQLRAVAAIPEAELKS